MERVSVVKIRKFRSSDAPEVARLHRSTIRNVNSKDYTRKQIEVWSGRTSAKRFRDINHRTAMFVAVEDRKIIGFADYKDNELLGLYIHKNYIRKGVGRKLILYLEYYAHRSGIKSLRCEATITAREFYRRMGYKTLRKTTHNIKGQKLPVYVMRKSL